MSIAAPPIPAEESLRNGWIATAPGRLYARNGAESGYQFGGHDLANNPALRATMEALAEQYIPLCAQKLECWRKERELEVLVVGRSEALKKEQAAAISEELKGLDGKLVQLQQNALAQLLTSGSGLEVEMARRDKINEQAGDISFGYLTTQERLSREDAKQVARQVIGSIIKTLRLVCEQELSAHSVLHFVPNDHEAKR